MKKGDKVIVKDNSYCVTLEEGKPKMGLPAGTKWEKGEVCKIVETDLKLPAYEHLKFNKYEDDYNDTIIRGLETDNIYYTRKRFLEKEKIKPKTIKLTDEQRKAFEKFGKKLAEQKKKIYHGWEIAAKAFKEELEK